MTAIAVGPQGNVYAIDEAARSVQVFSGSGSFVTKWYIDLEIPEGEGDPLALEPVCLTTDLNGSVFVADARTRTVKRFTATGSFVNEWPYRDSIPNEELYVYGMPPSLAATAGGRVLVGDGASLFVTGYDETGSITFKSRPAVVGEKSRRYYPAALAAAPEGGFLVADTYECVVKRFNSEGSCVASFGRHGSEAGEFEFPSGVAVGSDGTIFVADVGNERVQYFSRDGSFLGQFGSYGKDEGEFSGPITVAVAADGTVYVADTGNHRIQYFRPVPAEDK
ncbi:MAG: hypothetical protein PVH29_11820 [Candidatus Zixiibacteriota bacterium]